MLSFSVEEPTLMKRSTFFSQIPPSFCCLENKWGEYNGEINIQNIQFSCVLEMNTSACRLMQIFLKIHEHPWPSLLNTDASFTPRPSKDTILLFSDLSFVLSFTLFFYAPPFICFWCPNVSVTSQCPTNQYTVAAKSMWTLKGIIHPQM